MASRISAWLARLESRLPAPSGCERCRWYDGRTEAELRALADYQNARYQAAVAKAVAPAPPPGVAKLARECAGLRSSPACEDCLRIYRMTEADLSEYTDLLGRVLADADAKAAASAGPPSPA